ncbi:Protein SRC2 [Rhynchospora pubera]|uniref:Protein SRC2 n=1 Tax=Rhynchospora pubera TaxID=906938 RepID=A0AAV8CH03_9POAL|nr:Protein SRC2 [Rhynchospora pubera]
MEYRTLDLTLISARDLKNVNFISKLQAYAIMSIPGSLQFQQTPVDRHGNKNPKWNYTANFFIPADGNLVDGSLRILIRANRILGDKNIGEIYIPLKSLMPYDGCNGTRAAYFASYQIRKAGSRKPRGVINISYMLREQLPSLPMSQTQEPVKLREQLATPPDVPAATACQNLSTTKADICTAVYAAPVGGFGRPPPVCVYGYPQQQPMQQIMPNQNNFGMGLEVGLLGGALGGLLIGDMISDAAAYDAGYDAGAYDAEYDAGAYDAGYDAGAYDAEYDAGAYDAGYDAGAYDAGYDAGFDDASGSDF